MHWLYSSQQKVNNKNITPSIYLSHKVNTFTPVYIMYIHVFVIGRLGGPYTEKLWQRAGVDLRNFVIESAYAPSTNLS